MKKSRPRELTPFLHANAARLRARLDAAHGNHDHVEERFRTAASVFREFSLVFHLAVTQLEHAEWLRGFARRTCSSRPEYGSRDRDATSSKGGSVAINHVFAGVAAADYDSALGWYERLMGRPPDVIVKEGEAMWQLTDNGWIYVVGDANRAGNALVTVLVDDLEDHVAELGERGLTTGPIDTVPGLFRKAVITDPEGNMITFAEDLSTND